jgi:hypothetical protein
MFKEKICFMRVEGDEMRVIGLRPNAWPITMKERSELENDFKEEFSNSLSDRDDAGVYVWCGLSSQAYIELCGFANGCFSYFGAAKLSDPTSGYFLHDGMLHLSKESEALAEKVAVMEARALSELLAAGVGSRVGGRL